MLERCSFHPFEKQCCGVNFARKPNGSAYCPSCKRSVECPYCAGVLSRGRIL